MFKKLGDAEDERNSRKEARELRSFSILWMGIIKEVFEMERKECKNQERLKMCRRKSMPERESALT